MESKNWSRLEVEIIVDDYLSMLSFELARVPYNKTKHRFTLSNLLPSRTEAAIEFKHANISAGLIDLGFFYIQGYQPRGNYQKLILEVLEERLFSNRNLLELGAFEADRPIVVPECENILSALQSPPAPKESKFVAKEPSPEVFRSPQPVNYLEREAKNRSLGDSGELFVIEFEKARLISAGREALAAKIEHTAKVTGDHAGFDVLSFETNGAERLIEVKTTKYGIATPFFATSNEVKISEKNSNQYSIYRIFSFAEVPRFYQLQGAISSSCQLTPSGYLAYPR
jgi:Domain of unknown function (DUF3883)